jgi:hypothetical protein
MAHLQELDRRGVLSTCIGLLAQCKVLGHPLPLLLILLL